MLTSCVGDEEGFLVTGWEYRFSSGVPDRMLGDAGRLEYKRGFKNAAVFIPTGLPSVIHFAVEE